MGGYSSKLLDLVRELRHGGALDSPSAVGRSSMDGRAPYTTIYLHIEDGRIVRFSYQTFGCGVSIAACEAIAELATGQSTGQCAAITPKQVVDFLEGVPDERRFCVRLALDALHAALKSYDDAIAVAAAVPVAPGEE